MSSLLMSIFIRSPCDGARRARWRQRGCRRRLRTPAPAGHRCRTAAVRGATPPRRRALQQESTGFWRLLFEALVVSSQEQTTPTPCPRRSHGSGRRLSPRTSRRTPSRLRPNSWRTLQREHKGFGFGRPVEGVALPFLRSDLGAPVFPVATCAHIVLLPRLPHQREQTAQRGGVGEVGECIEGSAHVFRLVVVQTATVVLRPPTHPRHPSPALARHGAFS